MPFSPTPTLLSRFTAARRIPTRPLAARGPDFDAAFDDDTLWFDDVAVGSAPLDC